MLSAVFNDKLCGANTKMSIGRNEFGDSILSCPAPASDLDITVTIIVVVVVSALTVVLFVVRKNFPFGLGDRVTEVGKRNGFLSVGIRDIGADRCRDRQHFHTPGQLVGGDRKFTLGFDVVGQEVADLDEQLPV